MVGGGGKVEPSAWAFEMAGSLGVPTQLYPPPHVDQFLDSWEDQHSSSHGDHQGSHPRPPLQPRTLPTERWAASSRGIVVSRLTDSFLFLHTFDTLSLKAYTITYVFRLIRAKPRPHFLKGKFLQRKRRNGDRVNGDDNKCFCNKYIDNMIVNG